MKACVEAVFHDPGLRFIFSTRSKVPNLLDEQGKDLHGDGYVFEPGRDEVVRDGEAGTIISFGDCLYRALDAVERLRQEGTAVRLINKASLNVVDESMMETIGRSPIVLVVEAFNRRTGLGSRFGTWLLERGYHPRYAHLGTWREGCGGLWEQAPHQGIDSEGILAHVRNLLG
jgi:transketolase C-terminal domain/subunit